MPDADLVVEIPVEAEPVVEGKSETAKTVEVNNTPANEPVEELKQQLATLTEQSKQKDAENARIRQEADAARQEAAKRTEELGKVRTDLTATELSAVDSAIQAAQSEAEGYARDQQVALEAGEWAKATDLGRKAARAEAKAVRLEEGKADLEARKAESPKTATTTQAKPADAFESAISNSTPRAQKWLRDHPTYVTDPALNRKANIAHLEALDAGHVLDSDAYFDFCEQKLGLKETPKTTNGKTEPRTRALPGAPVTRDTSPSGGQLSPTQVTLTPGEQARATDGTIVWNYSDPKIGAVKGQPVGLKEFARRKAAMIKEGRYGVLSDS